jgi:hypothetical protein
MTGRQVRLVALPAEHGGWGFVGEAVGLGLLVAPSWAGLGLGVAALAVFLLHQPLRLWVGDRRAGKRYPRTVLAGQVTALYGGVALLALAAALLAQPAAFWLPVVLAAPPALLQFYFDLARQSRAALAEVAGAGAMGASAAAIAMAGGWPALPALGLWAILAVRTVTSILYVRVLLRQNRDQPADVRPVWLAHAGGLGLLGALVGAGLVPGWAVLVPLGLAARAAWALTPGRRPLRAAIVGVSEIVLGLLLILLVAAGYALTR